MPLTYRSERRRRWLDTCLAGLLATSAVAPAQGDEAHSLRISQVRQLAGSSVRLRTFVDLLDRDGRATSAVTPGELTASLGERSLTVERFEPLAKTRDGVAHVFLIDVSSSLNEVQFQAIQGAVEAWIRDLGEADRAAIVAFGERSHVVVDFTADREALRDGLRSLAATDQLTLLHQALVDALALSARGDPGLPSRRVLVVMTDGRDEGSGLTADDVLERFREEPAPLYAIGYSQIRDLEERQRYLDLLRRFASASGGEFLAAGVGEFGASFAELRASTRRVWAADLDCPRCRANGTLQRLQVSVQLGERVLTAGRDVRVYPPARPAAADKSPSAAAAPALEAPAQAPAGGNGLLRWLAILAAIAAAGFLVARLRGGRGASTADTPPAATQEPAASAVDPPPVAPRPAVPQPVPANRGGGRPAAAVPRTLRFVVVRGRHPGRQYRLLLQDRAVVGSEPACDCAIVDEPGLGGAQFEVFQSSGQLFLEDLATGEATLHDGLEIDPKKALRSNDLVGTREVILRVLLD